MAGNNTGRFVWYELLTSDPKAAIEFYTQVVGWKTQPYEGEYTMFVASQGPVGGTMRLPDEAKKMGAPSHWMAHVQVADVDKTVARARALGGRVFHEPENVPKIGRFAIIADPLGASIAVFTPEQDMPRHDVSKHGEFLWHEVVTTDQDKAFAFYHELFGWERVRDVGMGPMGNYLLYGKDGQEFGGMFNKPKDMQMPPTFFYYIQVDDLAVALDRAKKLGAKVMNGPMEVPGGAHIVQLTDPQGAAFALHEMKKA